MTRLRRLNMLVGFIGACNGGGGGGPGDDSGTGADGNPNGSDARPRGAILFDDFEYAAGRDDPSVRAIFTSHGWSDVKSVQAGNVNATGYVYTVGAIPGYSGTFPGGGSRVLALEALSGTFGRQTDFWLKYGGQEAGTETVPGNVWFQFWIYVNHYDDPADVNDQMSQIGTRDKFIYPCAGPYPCMSTTGGNKWLFEVGANNLGPGPLSPYGLPSPGDLLMTSRDNTLGTVNYTAADPGNESKLFQQDINTHIAPNTWTLVKLHWDTSTANGTWEAWLTPRGQPTVKVAEWISGVTLNFTWTIDAPDIGGHRVFAMPTTIPGPNNNEFYDFWIYLDDFTMAGSEGGLPTY